MLEWSEIPYGEEQTKKIINQWDINTNKFVSPETALVLAQHSYNKIPHEDANNLKIALGATSSLATNDERKWREHKINIAIITQKTTDLIKVILQQWRTKEQEDKLTTNLIEYYIAKIAGTIQEKLYLPIGRWESITHVKRDNSDVPLALSMYKKRFNQEYISSTPLDKDVIIFPGSFNPIHQGHDMIRQYLETNFPDKKFFFEISRKNADKGTIDLIETIKRSQQFDKTQNFIINNASTFDKKVDLYKKINPKHTTSFAVGADIWMKIIDKKYYNNDENKLKDFLTKCKKQKIKFIVFPRNINNKRTTYQTINEKSTLDNNLLDKLIEQDINLTTFENQYSSSYLRNRWWNKRKYALDTPPNVFRNNAKRFLANETVAWIWTVWGTAWLEPLIKKIFTTNTKREIANSVSWPIVEKITFFILPFIKELRKQKWFKWIRGNKILRESIKAIIYDIIFHDPIYIATMFAAQNTIKTTPLRITSIASYLFSAIAVGQSEIRIDQYKLEKLKRKLQKEQHAISENYYETRLIVDPHGKSPNDILNYFQNQLEYNLTGSIIEQSISDKYYDTSLAKYGWYDTNLRTRINITNDEYQQISTQLIRTKTKPKINKKSPYNLYPIHKQKITIPSDDRAQITKRIKSKGTKKPTLTIDTKRKYLNNENGLYITCDRITGFPKIIVELKARNGIDIIKKATFQLMEAFGAIPTTRNKKQIIQNHGEISI